MKSWLAPIGQRLLTFLRSIRFRLTVWYVAILAVILVIFCAFVYYRQAYDLKLDMRGQLQVKAQEVAGLYRYANLTGAEGGTPQLPDLTSQGMQVLSDANSLALIGPSGQTLQKMGKIDDSLISQLVQTWAAASHGPEQILYTVARTDVLGFDLDIKDQTIYLVTPLLLERRPVGLIILGSPIDPGGQLSRLLVTLALASLATLAVALGGGYLLATRAMAPVRTITRTARGISETDLHKRLNLGKQDELGELANTFDAMLNRLQAAFDRQRQFTADASHELRTPLTIVGLEADQSLARRRTGEEYERSIRVIKSENEFMARLVNDLLTLARMDAGQTQMAMEPVDLSEVALDVVERLSSLASRDGVDLHVGDFPEVRVMGDAQYLSQLLTNLIENAIKYAGGRGHHVCLETGRKIVDEQAVGWVQVEDDGPGIPAEHLPHLFDRFYRVDKSRARRQEGAGETEKEPEGSGLGLSIVQWIAQAHGGRVLVRSEAGKGTTFEVQIPGEE